MIKKIEIEKLANDGEGLAYDDNKPVYVYYALPGEVIEAEVFTNQRNALEGKIIDIKEESQYRVKPQCPYYGLCGGCTLQHLDYFETLKYKREKLSFMFSTKIRKSTNKTTINNTIKSDFEYRYRNQTDLPVAFDGEKNIAGLYIRGSNQIFDMNDCVIQKANLSLTINKILKIMTDLEIYGYNYRSKKGVVKYISVRTNSLGEMQITFVLKQATDLEILVSKTASISNKVVSIYQIINDNDKSREALRGPKKLLFGSRYLKEYIDDKIFLLSPESFFQLNYDVTKKVYQLIKEKGNFSKEDVILDAYAGVASIGIYLADSVKQVWSIEINNSAVKAAEEAVKLNKIENIKVISGDVVKMTDYLTKQHFDKVIFDPPRSGLGEDVVNFVLKNEPKSVIYLSCDVKSLVKDLKMLSSKYDILETTPIDMFPMTAHVESITFLALKV
ncbi:MAG: 23S rRNA (uracil(1939)-C(5))-methyltransferase RlmD [Acholeplasmataceae bacterium]|nr:23S rRNA (uracil(1939)-C(5))-methyltransferase RlmD [Acholeplasmataceae bacterium]